MMERVMIRSDCLHKNVSVGLVLPEGAVQRVMILLHGYNGCFAELRDKLPLQDYANRFHLLIACPELGNGYYIDRPAEGSFCGAFLAQELPAFLQNHCGIDRPGDWILAGISMGGYGSLLTACHFPNCFQHAVSIGGALIAHDVSIGNPEVVGNGSSPAAVRYFLDTFGPDISTLDNAPDRNPVAALPSAAQAENPPFFWLACGEDDLLFDRNLAAVNKLAANGLPYRWLPLPGGHTFACFERALRMVLDLLCGSAL